MEKRKVKILEYTKENGYDNGTVETSETGTFHAFGVNYEEFEEGPGNFTTAIVEMPDGTIRNIYVELVKFIKE